jgi:hypothetical protein
MSPANERRPLRRLAALAAITAGFWLLAAPSAHAVDQLETGVWWRNQTGAATLPTPPQVPPGGLWVSNDATGPSAVSAIRFTVPDAGGVGTLSLHLARFTAQPATPATPAAALIHACVVTGAWTTPANSPGPWSARPSFDCTNGSTPGQLSTDHSTMVFDLTVLPPGHSYDLALVPGTSAPSASDPTQVAGSPTFDLTFEPVKPTDLSGSTTAPTPPTPPTTRAAGTAVGPAPFGSLDVRTAPSAVVQEPVAVATPAAVRAVTPRSLAAPVATAVARTSTAARVIAGLVVGALALWAWRLLAARNTTVTALAGARPATSLSDPAPPGTQTGLRRRFTTGPRIGAPPALR